MQNFNVQFSNRFEDLAREAAIRKGLSDIFDREWFNITDFQKVIDLLNRKDYITTQEMENMRLLHCVHWGDMGPELANLTRQRICHHLGLNLEVVQPVKGTVSILADAPVESVTPQKNRSRSWLRLICK